MTFVVELRDLKKNLPRPVPHFWQRVLCVLRTRLAFLGLLGFALGSPVIGAPSGGALALLCGVLSAAVSATLGLLCDASMALSALFSDDASPALRLGQRLSLCFGAPLSPFDICHESRSFPTVSGYALSALAACSLLLFGSGFSRRESVQRGGRL